MPIESSPLVLKRLPDPEPGPRTVRIRVECCGICRTDLHVIEGDLPHQRLPLVPGHQVVGQVDRLGPSCDRFKIGDRIGIPWLRSTCRSCEYCQEGRENLCERCQFTGYHADGGFAQYAVVPEDFCYAIPHELNAIQAAPLLCAGIIGYRAFRRSQFPEGGALGIFGFGSSAHIVIQLALRKQARVYVITRGQAHRELAQELGARWVGERAENLPVKLDSAILFAPAGELVLQALSALKRGGTLAVAGIHLSTIPQLDYQKHLFFERDLRSVTANTRADGIALLQEASKEPIKVHTRLYTLSQANQALQDLKSDRIQGSGILKVETP